MEDVNILPMTKMELESIMLETDKQLPDNIRSTLEQGQEAVTTAYNLEDSPTIQSKYDQWRNISSKEVPRKPIPDVPVDQPSNFIYKVNEVEKHIKDREGSKYKDGKFISYQDRNGNLTGGYGHLMTDLEQDKYPSGTPLTKELVTDWWKADFNEAMEAGKNQARLLKQPTLAPALTSVVFQMGKNWNKSKLVIVRDKAGKPVRNKKGEVVKTQKGFPAAWKALLQGDWAVAIAELEFVSKDSKVHSKWFDSDNGKRVGDFTRAIKKLMKQTNQTEE